MAMKYFLGVFFFCSVLALGSGPSIARPGRGSQSSSYDDFPLWKDVPGRSFAKLGGGRLRNGSRWAAFASRVGGGSRGGDNPCLTVARITRFGEYGAPHGCGPLAPAGQDPPVMAMMTTSANLPGQGKGETIISMSFKPFITSVKISTGSNNFLYRRTQMLNRYQQRKTHLSRFRYVSLGLEKVICIAKIVGFNADGDVAFEAVIGECESS